jgi:predicted metal-binding protein
MAGMRVKKRKIFADEALRQGAAAAEWVSIRDIVLDERVRLKCQIPLCDSYGRNLMCPPRLPEVAVFRKMLLLFSEALLVQVAAPLAMKPVRSKKDVYRPAKKLHALINNLEKMAFEEGCYFATGLIGGCCRLCPECAAAAGETKCRHPFQARPSMEAMGIDVMATLEKAGMSCSFPVLDHVRWTGLLLL